MAEFSQKRGKRHDDDTLGSAVDFILANARLVLGMGGAAVLGIATLAVKRVRPHWTSYTWGSQRRMTGLEPTMGVNGSWGEEPGLLCPRALPWFPRLWMF